MDKINLIITHGGCPDGSCAAWIFNRFLDKIYGYKAPVKYMSHQDKLDYKTDYTNYQIVLLDYILPLEDIQKIKEMGGEFYLFDHHPGAFKVSLEMKQSWIQMDKCASQIVWEYCFPDKKEPWFLTTIAARDLGQDLQDYQMYQGKAMFYEKKLNSKGFEEMLNMKPREIERFELRGEVHYTRDMEDMKFHQRTLKIAKFQDHIVYLTSAPKNLLYELSKACGKENNPEIDFLIRLEYQIESHNFKLNLRGWDKVDLNILANQFGGGGHPNASSCVIDDIKIHLTYLRNVS